MTEEERKKEQPGKKVRAKCDRDCLHCPYPDCVQENMSLEELRSSNERDREIRLQCQCGAKIESVVVSILETTTRHLIFESHRSGEWARIVRSTEKRNASRQRAEES